MELPNTLSIRYVVPVPEMKLFVASARLRVAWQGVTDSRGKLAESRREATQQARRTAGRFSLDLGRATRALGLNMYTALRVKRVVKQ